VPTKSTAGILKISPNHPIKISNVWHRPCEKFNVLWQPCIELYNFVLTDHHIVCAEDTWTVTFAHGLKDDVCRHPFFGTDLIVSSLEKIAGWDDGLVFVSKCIRDDDGLGIVVDFQ
jgi:hypothetical protein